ncbi:GATA-binding protein [Vigna unguiculata]|uniref:GATA-binding protein n=1 Tax=Vigna unguiculata TaxID=3917 RepID=A0A4D6MFN1_VIGUN|nr:GATA-binding protein [Vigna unguiculata]
MTPYSAPSLQPQTQIFISPNNQDCPTFFNIFHAKPTQNYQQDETMVLHDGSSSNNMNSGDPIRNRNEGNLGWYKTEEEDTKHSHGSGKWMSSKMRLMKKITSPTSDRFNPRNNTTRVCSDCNTTTTPLWRSGPKGPKSLCNACGIRQRKARRAMAEASSNPINSVCAKTRVYNKEKNKYKNKYKSTTTTTASSAGSSEGVRKIECFKDFAISLSSKKSCFQQVFPRDEVAEAAMLLMELSCGFLHS